jgi:hypothetical protein
LDVQVTRIAEMQRRIMVIHIQNAERDSVKLYMFDLEPFEWYHTGGEEGR